MSDSAIFVLVMGFTNFGIICGMIIGYQKGKRGRKNG